MSSVIYVIYVIYCNLFFNPKQVNIIYSYLGTPEMFAEAA